MSGSGGTGYLGSDNIERDRAAALATVARQAERRNGDWMQTFTGRAFWPLDARPEEIDPDDIAHALGMLCRYGGHVSDFYSVAEHCVLMSWAVSEENALWALLHDSTEAYMCDLVRPLKRSMPAYAAAERDLMFVICERFGLDWHEPEEVKLADNRILQDERAALMTAAPLPWHSVENVEPLGVDVRCWTPPQATEAWINRFVVLTGLFPPSWEKSA